MTLRAVSPQGGGRFRHDPVTLVADGLLAAYSFVLYALSPVLVLLRGRLHVSYTLVSLHPALWAAGTILTGLAFDWLVRRRGRRRVLRVGLGGMVAGLALLALGRPVAVTLLAAAVLGTTGTLVQTAAFGVLSDAHPGHRDRALVEGSIVGSAAALLAPLLVGGLAGTAAGWRAALALPAAVALGLVAALRRAPLPSPTVLPNASGQRLPLRAWAGAGVVGTSVAIEFCVVYYAPQLLRAVDGFSAGDAATALSVQYAGLLVGRLLGVPLAGRQGRTVPLLLTSLAVTTAGFAVFWLIRTPGVALAGLAVTGLGIANLFPLALSLTVATAYGATDAATARAQLLAGVAALVAPFALGVAADAVGVHTALATEPLLLALASLLLVSARPDRRPSSGAETGSAPRGRAGR